MGNGLADKHKQLADRIRGMTAELRDAATSESRRRSILDQLRAFETRLRLAHCAHVLIYVSSLVLVSLVIVLALERRHGPVDATLFVLGLACVFAALALEIAELLMAHRTMARELQEL
jgi:hypothetical protein